MKKRKSFLVLLLCICMTIPTVQNVKATDKPYTKYSKVIAFGDSYSDNGEAKRISTEIVNKGMELEKAVIKPSNELYWRNRYSNGRTAVEVLAARLGVPLVNYAVGGAATGENNYSAWMDVLGNTGVLGQIERFEKSLKGKKADAGALYFIFASANDYFYFADYNMPGKVEAVADEAVDNIKTAVRRLNKLGAKSFFIVNSSDLSMVPYEIKMKRTKEAAAFTKYVNQELPKELEQLKKVTGISITVFDITKVSSQIKKAPSKYGISVMKSPCQVTDPKPKKAKANPDSYYFWDEWHYSSAVHKIIGKRMYQELIK